MCQCTLGSYALHYTRCECVLAWLFKLYARAYVCMCVCVYVRVCVCTLSCHFPGHGEETPLFHPIFIPFSHTGDFPTDFLVSGRAPDTSGPGPPVTLPSPERWGEVRGQDQAPGSSGRSASPRGQPQIILLSAH